MTIEKSFEAIPQRRLNPLTSEWVLVSPHRATRPWLGQVERNITTKLPAYDPDCYLCPGNERAGGIKNPSYTGTFVFDNDFPALLPDQLTGLHQEEIPFLVREAEPGVCRVVCFSPRHDLTLPELDLSAISQVLSTWVEHSNVLGGQDFINYVQVFENKGELMGCSNPHPHSQIWANSHIPNEPAKELVSQIAYFNEHRRPLLVDCVAEEHKRKERILVANDHFTALVPFWAIWPFEVLICAHRSGLSRLTEMTSAELSSLAEVMKSVTTRYDNLFEISFPYSMGFHQAPFDGNSHLEWTLHAHFYPPLLRSSTIRKFMVGYELLAMPQRDITPESAADRLRSLPETHYKQQNRI